MADEIPRLLTENRPLSLAKRPNPERQHDGKHQRHHRNPAGSKRNDPLRRREVVHGEAE